MDKVVSIIFGKFSVSKKEVLSVERCFLNQIPEVQEILQPDKWEVYLKSAILNIIKSIEENVEPTELNAKNGLYLGTAGIAYMFYYLSKNPSLKQHHLEFIRKAVDFIKPALNVALTVAHKKKYVPSLLLGNCGIYAVAAVVFNVSGTKWLSLKYYKLYSEASKICTKQKFLKCGSDDLFVGRAGYICGALWLSKELRKPLDLARIYPICDVLIESGIANAKSDTLPTPLLYSYYKIKYLGISHGLASVLYVLMLVPHYLQQNTHYAQHVKASIDYILSLQSDEGNFPLTFDKDEPQNDLVQWCHGASGIIYLMAKAYLLWNEEKYLKSCEKAADLVWKKGLLIKGPGLCHGISGNAYVFLLMYRLTHDQKYLCKAFSFAKFMESQEFKNGARVPDNPYCLFEGLAGTACFLSDLLIPFMSSFPFMEIFSVY